MVTKSRIAPKTRRTPGDMDRIRSAILRVLGEDNPMTVRQVFYRLVSAGAIAKTEGEYKTTVIRLLGEMRLDGQVPFGWIADNTRWMRKPNTHGSLEQALQETARVYRRSVWDAQDVYCEVWLEKDALAGVLYDVTGAWDVPLMVTRGYPSLSYLHSAAEVIAKVGKPSVLYYFGDLDPSGVDITRNVEAGIRKFAPRAPITFERVAVNRDQVDQFMLPTRPTKSTDSRTKNFDGESVEVDAIAPRDLRSMVESCILRHINPVAHSRMKLVEKAERATLSGLAGQYSGRLK